MRKDIEDAIALGKSLKGTTMVGQKGNVKFIESKLMPDEAVLLLFSANANYQSTDKKKVKALNFSNKKPGLFIVTNKRIIHLSKQLFKEEIQQISLNQIVGMNTKASGLFSALCFDTANSTFEVDMAPDAANTCIYIINDLNNKSSSHIQPTESARVDPYGELEKLAELKTKGIITEAEFEAKKKQLLNI